MRLSTIFGGNGNPLSGGTDGIRDCRSLTSVGTQSCIRSAASAALAEMSGAGNIAGRPPVSGIGSGSTLTGACVHVHAAFMVSSESMRQAITQQFMALHAWRMISNVETQGQSLELMCEQRRLVVLEPPFISIL
jgi:hypothetical protein